MTIHVSLPKELEALVHAEVGSGMYGSASEVVREALRRFFGGHDGLSSNEIARIRQIIAPRLEAVEKGSAELTSAEEYFESRTT